MGTARYLQWQCSEQKHAFGLDRTARPLLQEFVSEQGELEHHLPDLTSLGAAVAAVFDVRPISAPPVERLTPRRRTHDDSDLMRQ